MSNKIKYMIHPLGTFNMKKDSDFNRYYEEALRILEKHNLKPDECITDSIEQAIIVDCYVHVYGERNNEL